MEQLIKLIRIALGAPFIIVAVFCYWIAGLIYPRYKELFREALS